MSDTPTLEQAFDDANAELTSKEVSPEKEEPAESQDKTKSEAEPKEEKEETPEGEKTDSKAEEIESFADKGELSGKTPEELDKVYKDWQRSYTIKRQAERKELEDLRKQVADRAEVKVDPKQQKALDQMTPQEYALHVANMAKEEVKVAGDNAYIDAQQKSFYESDPRLNQDNPEFDSDLHDLVVLRLSNARELHEGSGKPITEFDFVGEAKEFIKAFDERIVKNNKSYLQKQSKIARTRSEDFAKDAPKTSGAKAKKKNMDLDESVEAALEG